VEDDIGRLLASGERAAFHGRPAAGVRALEQAEAAASAAGREAEALAARWLLGVSLAAAGRFGGALAALDPLVRPPAEAAAEHRLFAALGAATTASVHRQLGRHTVARAYDEQGLALSDGAGEPAFDCRLGLAADAVGLGDAREAAEELARAEALTAQRPDWWRQRVRAGWVRAEVALLTGDPEAASRAAEGAVTLAEASGAPRHVAKGLLFAGVAHVEAGRFDEAITTMRRGAVLAESLGTVPLIWPTRAMLGALLADSDVSESDRCLDAARAAAQTIADDLPDDLRAEWLGRPDVAALLAI
jgi:tetratricopeptide (TPR) repeat protein